MAKSTDADDYLELAKEQFARVKAAHDATYTDWTVLATFGHYCLEAAVTAATLHGGGKKESRHWAKAKQAKKLAKQGLPDVEDLLEDLNSARKAANYGDADYELSDDYDADGIIEDIEQFISAVEKLISP